MTGPEALADVIARVEKVIVNSVREPPSPEFGLALVKISDLRRMITELQRRR